MMNPPCAHLAYGKERLAIPLDPALAQWHVIVPRTERALEDPRAAFAHACLHPIATPPLRDIIRPSDTVVIVTCDGTRALPNDVLIPWLLEALPVPEDRVTILLGNGTHRANTPEEIAAMFGEDVVRRVRIFNHDGYDPECNTHLGHTASGAPIWLDKRYVEASKRIVLGFIEPHFFAGFSGGAKAVAPGIAGVESILHLHGFDLIAHANSTWGVMEGNRVQEAIHAMARACPPDFLVNVALDTAKRITAVFAGDYVAAHGVGCAHVRDHAMVPVPHRFPLVVTSNSGFPLDQNLYQTVKGMSAAVRIIAEDGVIVMASECRDGIPAHGQFGTMLRQAPDAHCLEAMLRALPSPRLDQWQAQIFAHILARHEVVLYSQLDPDTARACLITPATDLAATIKERIERRGRGIPVAVLPEGPLAAPYVE